MEPTPATGRMLATVRAGAQRRLDVADRLRAQVPTVVEVASVLARRFAAGATLHVVGGGLSGHDADHFAVEFLHPVTVGRRAIPALAHRSVDRILAAEGDVLVALALDASLDVAAMVDPGCTTVSLAPDRHGAQHHLRVDPSDPMLAREAQITWYHLLWELVHECLEARSDPSATAGADGSGPLARLYPSVYGGDPGQVAPEGTESSTEQKVDDVQRLRAEVLEQCGHDLVRLALALRRSAAGGGTVWTMGNGGSSTDASALAHLLRTSGAGSQVRARSLTDDVATVTALSNDVSYDVAFARMLAALARPGDVVVGCSTSGESKNLLRAFAVAADSGCTTVGFAGGDGGAMATAGLDACFVVPSSSVHRIQEAQASLAHVLVELVRNAD